MSAALTAMTVAGIMSGTSADGIDIAFTRITPHPDDPEAPALKLLGHAGFPFAPALRRAVLAAMNADAIATAELARLNWRLGQAYAEALEAGLERHPCRLDLVGCHGQTIYHQATPARYLGREASCTWQIGEMAMLAEQSGVPVVSNFRPADMVVGGQGAPLVPLLDYVLFRHPTRGRVLQNLGGIGNLTALPPKAGPLQVVAFDTGPGNMVIDQLMQQLFGKRFDRGGKTGARGTVIKPVVSARLREPFFAARPPKTAGREQFGSDYTIRFLEACRKAGGSPEDAIASATALTAESVALAYSSFLFKTMRKAPVDFIVSGGGARNLTLMQMLHEQLEPLDCTVRSSDDLGLPAEAKEAAAFALLAYETWHRRPGNIPSATGAARPAILGEITYA
ncbi:MAG: anhydro-N-acetylmuramic acid kinase [Acidobacteriaceae bacterium]|jgi:anhydro-N-acetylmuramic acid kinase|nr:anhydro-N-acetylmuramic acid kinase [Acidobacteriaceae bacterium]